MSAYIIECLTSVYKATKLSSMKITEKKIHIFHKKKEKKTLELQGAGCFKT